MEFAFVAVGVVVALGAVAFAIPKSSELLARWRRDSLRTALLSEDSKIRAEAIAWLEMRRTVREIEFARPLLKCSDYRVVLDIAPQFLRHGVSLIDDALEALAQVAANGSEQQRQEAVSCLVSAPRLCQSIVKPMIGLLSSEPDRQIRLHVVLVLVRVAEPNSREYLDSVTRVEVVKAVVKRLEDEADEVRVCATACLAPGGQLAELIQEGELVLIELLRSPQQEMVDWVARLILAH